MKVYLICPAPVDAELVQFGDYMAVLAIQGVPLYPSGQMQARAAGGLASIMLGMDIEALRACEYWTEREGRAAVALWRSSGLSAKAFARSVGLAPARLAYWRCRVEPAAGMTVAPMTLAPVTVIDRRPRAIVIELLCGRAVRIEGDFDDALLARVIAAAERSC